MNAIRKFVLFFVLFVSGLCSAATYYVDSTNGDDGNAGSADEPFASIAEALTREDVTEVVLAKGDYAPTSTVSIVRAVTVRGADGVKREDVRVSGSGKRRVFSINHAQAVLSGLTVENGSVGDHGSGVSVGTAGGTVQNCVVRNCRVTASSKGGAIHVTGTATKGICYGRVLGCVVTNNYVQGGNGGGGSYGGALQMLGGIAANCLVADNYCKGDGIVVGMGIRAAYALIVNCTVVRNRGTDYAGVYATNSRVVNTIVHDNDIGSDGILNSGCYSSSSSFAGTFTPVALSGSTAVLDLPDPDGRYTPCGTAALGLSQDISGLSSATYYVPAIDILPVGSSEAYDAFGHARPTDMTTWAMGCVEFPTIPVVSFTCSQRQAIVGSEVTLTAWSQGLSNVTKYEWDFEGSGTFVEDGESASHVYVTAGNFHPVVRVTTDEGTFTGSAYHPVEIYEEEVRAVPSSDIYGLVSALREGQTLVLPTGNYTLSDFANLTEGVVIKGESGNPEDVVIKPTAGGNRLFRIANKHAVLQGVTLDRKDKNCSTSYSHLYLYGPGGVVSNCVIRNHLNSAYSGGPAVYATGADSLLTHCVVSNCVGGGTGYADFTVGVHLEGKSRMHDSLLAFNNAKNSKNETSIGAAYLKGGYLVNCTVVGNHARGVGGVRVDSGAVSNCVIAANVSDGTGAGYHNIKPGTDAKFVNCAFDTEEVAGNWFEKDKEFYFSGYAQGNFTPVKGSKLIDNGDPNVEPMGKDLLGNDRVMGESVDIGAYEYNPYVLSVTLKSSAAIAFTPADVTLTAEVTGAKEGAELVYTWRLNGGDPVETTVNTYPLTLTEAQALSVSVSVFDKESGETVSDAKENLVKVAPKVMLVKDGNPTAAYPYDTEENAAANLKTAVEAQLTDGIVELMEGKHALGGLTIDRGIEVRGATDDPADTILALSGPLTLNEATAVLHGFAIELSSQSSSALIDYDARGGVISNCIIRGGSPLNYCIRNASANGVLSHTVITNVSCTGQSGGGARPKGFIVDVGGGRFSNLLISNCYFPSTEQYAFIWMQGTLENCTIVSNRFKQSSFDWNAKPGTIGQPSASNVRYLLLPYAGATVRANVFAANTTNGVPAFTYGTFVSESSVTVEANVSDGMKAGESGRIASAEALFRRPANGDWRLRANSPARDIVPKSELPADLPATDLGGNPRVYGVGLDAGCYECRSGGLMLLVR